MALTGFHRWSDASGTHRWIQREEGPLTEVAAFIAFQHRVVLVPDDLHQQLQVSHAGGMELLVGDICGQQCNCTCLRLYLHLPHEAFPNSYCGLNDLSHLTIYLDHAHQRDAFASLMVACSAVMHRHGRHAVMLDSMTQTTNKSNFMDTVDANEANVSESFTHDRPRGRAGRGAAGGQFAGSAGEPCFPCSELSLDVTPPLSRERRRQRWRKGLTRLCNGKRHFN